jgi:type IV pilus biogenesis protein CpaD/CtpE
MRKNAIALAVAALLAGCGATMPTTTVKVPVPVQCKETVPDRPVMPTEQFKAKPKLDEFVKASQAELERREGYEGKLRTALEACTAPISPP